MSELQSAWEWRESRGALAESGALRVFHGPGEGSGELADVSVDLFVADDGKRHAWITEWDSVSDQVHAQLKKFYQARGVASAVMLARPKQGVPDAPEALWGEPPEGRFVCREGELRFLISLRESRHPGLFLDHAPLRRWLCARMKGLRVLNTFAYTGSLSIASGMGDAAHVTTLDLSRPAVEWARANWEANSLPADRGDFIFGDVFEWLPRFARDKRQFECVILDPPSFARGKKGGEFSTSKDLVRLHKLAMALVAPGGYVVTSINSANIPVPKFEAEIEAAARESKMKFKVLSRIEQPETFPSRLGDREGRYLKGLVLLRD